MSKENLPEKVNPFRLAEHSTSMQGVFFVKNMPRLRSSLANDEGEVAADVVFGIDEHGVKFVKGDIRAEVNLECQRCMEPFSYEIIDDFIFGIVNSQEEALRLPKKFDPVLTDEEGMLNLQDMIEDELIISLPIVPMHSEKDCKIKMPLVADSQEEQNPDEENPFKVIEILQSKRSKKHEPSK